MGLLLLCPCCKREKREVSNSNQGNQTTSITEDSKEATADTKEAGNSGDYVIAQTPAMVLPEKILETIVADYKGEAVFVDFWATWCGPCLNAMKTMKAIKPTILEKGVKIIYISNESSPKEKWTAMLPDLGGIHYYLDQSAWEGLAAHYNIRGIPTYMVFDKEGKKRYETAGYPGNETILEELEKVW